MQPIALPPSCSAALPPPPVYGYAALPPPPVYGYPAAPVVPHQQQHQLSFHQNPPRIGPMSSSYYQMFYLPHQIGPHQQAALPPAGAFEHPDQFVGHHLVLVCTGGCGCVAQYSGHVFARMQCANCGQPMAPAPQPGQYLAVQHITTLVFSPPRLLPVYPHPTYIVAMDTAPAAAPAKTMEPTKEAATAAREPPCRRSPVPSPVLAPVAASQSGGPPVEIFRGQHAPVYYDPKKTTLLIKSMPRSMDRAGIWELLTPFSAKIDYVFWPRTWRAKPDKEGKLSYTVNQSKDLRAAHTGLLFVNFKRARDILMFCDCFKGDKPGSPWIFRKNLCTKKGKALLKEFREVFKKIRFCYAECQGLHGNVLRFVEREEQRRNRTPEGHGKNKATPCEWGPLIFDPNALKFVNLIEDDGNYRVHSFEVCEIADK